MKRTILLTLALTMALACHRLRQQREHQLSEQLRQRL